MVTVNIKERVHVVEHAPEELNLKAVRQVTDILEGATKKPATVERNTGYMVYRVPFPGVRYYTFE